MRISLGCSAASIKARDFRNLDQYMTLLHQYSSNYIHSPCILLKITKYVSRVISLVSLVGLLALKDGSVHVQLIHMIMSEFSFSMTSYTPDEMTPMTQSSLAA